MKLEVHHRCDDFDSYRAARVKSLFNVDTGANFDLELELPIEDRDWKVGVVYGPSGSGKTSVGRLLFDGRHVYKPRRWPRNKPIIDAIAPAAEFDAVTAALSAVGLGSVPSWLRPYHVLSNGEKFRADLARIICERPRRIVIDEFTSELNRQIARFGSLAFGKAWRRGDGQCVVLTPHRDVIRWLQPDWVLDTGTGKFTGRYLQRRPPFDLEIYQTDWRYWHLFEPHHYLKMPRMVAAKNYVGVVEGEPVAHVALSTRPGLVEARACRLVVMPEWQGAGIGVRFLNTIAQRWLDGLNRFDRRMTTLFHTSHPGLCAALRRDRRWTQVSATLHGSHRGRSIESIARSARKRGKAAMGAGYGGHFRAVQGFRYIGDSTDE